jgi:protein-S-isoprenylcysteine O-methyltransferase Ste14
MRFVSAGWFMLLAALLGRFLFETIRTATFVEDPLARWASIVAGGCSVLFYLTISWLMLARPVPDAQSRGLMPSAVAIAATYLPWLAPWLPAGQGGALLASLSAVTVLVGEALVLATIRHLGRSFSIVPQARRLVSDGPYALLRHPLYAAEAVGMIGVLMQRVWYAAVPFFALHLGLQILRIGYEERLLSASLPNYASYAAQRARLIPGVW